MASPKKKVVRTRRRERKNVEKGQVHISSSFNNTMVTITDTHGNALSWASAGGLGFRGRHGRFLRLFYKLGEFVKGMAVACLICVFLPRHCEGCEADRRQQKKQNNETNPPFLHRPPHRTVRRRHRAYALRSSKRRSIRQGSV